MKLTYFALKPMMVGDEERLPGDLVPEAAFWPSRDAYVRDFTIAPVMVSTLNREQRDYVTRITEGVNV